MCIFFNFEDFYVYIPSFMCQFYLFASHNLTFCILNCCESPFFPDTRIRLAYSKRISNHCLEYALEGSLESFTGTYNWKMKIGNN